MKDTLEYKGFIGTVHFSTEDEIFFGRIAEIDDLISFEGKSVADIKKSFKEAVADYLQICAKNKKPIFKSYKGNFNVRIEPDLHKKAVRKSLKLGMSLNQFVQKAIEKEILEGTRK